MAGVWSRSLALAALVASCAGQSASLYEITSANFAQASAQPVAWLLQLETLDRRGQMVAGAVRPVMQQLAQYYNVQQTSKGVRVGHIHMQQQPQLQKAFCGGGECPALVLMQNGRAQVSGATAR